MRLSWQYAIIHFFVPFTFSFCFNSIAIIGDYRLFSIDIRLFVLPRFRKFSINIKWLKTQYFVLKCLLGRYCLLKIGRMKNKFFKTSFFLFPVPFRLNITFFFHFKRFVLLHSTIYYLSRPFIFSYFYLSFFAK